MYSKLFDWIVVKINTQIDPVILSKDKDFDSSSKNVIGVLDIYGFEIFEHNSFEQFCINYVNEKLQQIFIEQTIKSEQEEYQSEGIQWVPVEYFNNKIVVDLIDKHRAGILSYLDEECILPGGNPERFFRKIFVSLKDNPHLLKKKTDQDSFIVKHYAGDVTYEIAEFITKNNDLCWIDFIVLGEASGLSTLNSIYKGMKENFSKKLPKTQAQQFKGQVGNLIETLEKCYPHYVRCIKPNDNKRPELYDNERCLHQVKYLGLKENVRVRRAGYALRIDYTEFKKRYKMLSKKTWPNWKGDNKEGFKHISGDLKLEENKDYDLGKTKCFIKSPKTVFKFEELRENKIVELVIQNQSLIRAKIAMNLLIKYKSVLKIQQAFRIYYDSIRSDAIKKLMGSIYNGKKIRRRLSVALFPIGDYLYMTKNPIWIKKGNKKIEFSDFCWKVNRKFKVERRLILLTQEDLYFSQYATDEKKLAPRYDRISKLKKMRSIPIKNIKEISVGNLHDSFLAITENSNVSTIICCERKSEFISRICSIGKNQHSIDVKVNVSETLNVVLKCKKSHCYTFKNVSAGEISKGLLEIEKKNEKATILVNKEVEVKK